eukprot:TRINITY_DN838_c2_g2_i2.p1 TRINITY_DN838_c2_g2~~TRINITY_DN838_c2_g2_i2.p1  ORF type:complete len:211 (+),score=24.62 TRINITY_DN838_c2_g2_i2:60-692(+)
MHLPPPLPLQQIVAYLSEIQVETREDEPTIFDALEPPPIEAGKYMKWLLEGFMCSPECLGCALIYMKRSGLHITQYNVHRVLLGCMVLAVKHRDDIYYSDPFYARVGGVELMEIHRLVIELLRLLDWELYVSYEEYQDFLKSLSLPTPSRTLTPSPFYHSLSPTSSSVSLDSSRAPDSDDACLFTPHVVCRTPKRRASLSEAFLKIFCFA